MNKALPGFVQLHVHFPIFYFYIATDYTQSYWYQLRFIDCSSFSFYLASVGIFEKRLIK